MPGKKKTDGFKEVKSNPNKKSGQKQQGGGGGGGNNKKQQQQQQQQHADPQGKAPQGGAGFHPGGKGQQGHAQQRQKQEPWFNAEEVIDNYGNRQMIAFRLSDAVDTKGKALLADRKLQGNPEICPNFKQISLYGNACKYRSGCIKIHLKKYAVLPMDWAAPASYHKQVQHEQQQQQQQPGGAGASAKGKLSNEDSKMLEDYAKGEGMFAQALAMGGGGNSSRMPMHTFLKGRGVHFILDRNRESVCAAVGGIEQQLGSWAKSCNTPPFINPTVIRQPHPHPVALGGEQAQQEQQEGAATAAAQKASPSASSQGGAMVIAIDPPGTSLCDDAFEVSEVTTDDEIALGKRSFELKIHIVNFVRSGQALGLITRPLVERAYKLQSSHYVGRPEKVWTKAHLASFARNATTQAVTLTCGFVGDQTGRITGIHPSYAPEFSFNNVVLTNCASYDEADALFQQAMPDSVAAAHPDQQQQPEEEDEQTAGTSVPLFDETYLSTLSRRDWCLATAFKIALFLDKPQLHPSRPFAPKQMLPRARYNDMQDKFKVDVEYELKGSSQGHFLVDALLRFYNRQAMKRVPADKLVACVPSRAFTPKEYEELREILRQWDITPPSDDNYAAFEACFQAGHCSIKTASQCLSGDKVVDYTYNTVSSFLDTMKKGNAKSGSDGDEDSILFRSVTCSFTHPMRSYLNTYHQLCLLRAIKPSDVHESDAAFPDIADDKTRQDLVDTVNAKEALLDGLERTKELLLLKSIMKMDPRVHFVVWGLVCGNEGSKCLRVYVPFLDCQNGREECVVRLKCSEMTAAHKKFGSFVIVLLNANGTAVGSLTDTESPKAEEVAVPVARSTHESIIVPSWGTQDWTAYLPAATRQLWLHHYPSAAPASAKKV